MSKQKGGLYGEENGRWGWVVLGTLVGFSLLLLLSFLTILLPGSKKIMSCLLAADISDNNFWAYTNSDSLNGCTSLQKRSPVPKQKNGHKGFGRVSLNGLGPGWTRTRTQVAWLSACPTTLLPTQPGLTQNKQPTEQLHKQPEMDGQTKKQAHSNCSPITSWPLTFQASL